MVAHNSDNFGGGYGTLPHYENPLVIKTGDLKDFCVDGVTRRRNRLESTSPKLSSRLWGTVVTAAVVTAAVVTTSIPFLFVRLRYQSWRFPRQSDRLIFEENFNTLNRSLWTVERSLLGGGNGEFQLYTDNDLNVFLRKGMLHIKPGLFADLGLIQPNEEMDGDYLAAEVMTGSCAPYPGCANFVIKGCTDDVADACEKTGGMPHGDIINPVTSGRINTKGAFSFKFGRLEIRAKMPRGDWLWPALWLLPEENAYGPWPVSGEIDICEARGNSASYLSPSGEALGINTFGSTLHYGNAFKSDGSHVVATDTKGDVMSYVDGWESAHRQAGRYVHGANKAGGETADFASDFHTYGLFWSEDRMYTYVVYPDGKEEVVLDLSGGYANGFWEQPLGGAGAEGWGRESPFKGIPGTSRGAPFDKKFYLVMNVAVGGDVGGNFGYWSGSPWSESENGDGGADPRSKRQIFWDKRDRWLPSWEEAGEASALVVDWVRVWQ